MSIQVPGICRFLFVCFDYFVGRRNRSVFSENVVRTMASDHAEPGGKFFRMAYAPAHLPRFDQRVLHDVFGFLAVLQNPVGDREKRSTVRADNHFKCLAIAVNGRPVLFAFTGIHLVAIYSLDV